MTNIFICICFLSITIGVHGMYYHRLTENKVHLFPPNDNKPQLTCHGEGYKLYPTGSCYRLHLDQKVFDDANQTCSDEGAYLVEVNDEHEAHVIKDIEGLPTYPLTYVGLRARDDFGDWRTANGTPVEELYNVWEMGKKPPYSTIIKCAMIRHTGVLDNFECDKERAFLCEKKPCEKPQRNCIGEGYQFYSTGSCYKLHLDKKVFDEANTTCLEEGAHLAEVNHLEEAEVIKDIDGLPTEYPWTFVGLRSRDDFGDWRTANGTRVEDLYNIWEIGFKPSASVLYKCATIRRRGSWTTSNVRISERFCAKRNLCHNIAVCRNFSLSALVDAVSTSFRTPS